MQLDISSEEKKMSCIIFLIFKKGFAGLGNPKSNSHMNSRKGLFKNFKGGRNENKSV